MGMVMFVRGRAALQPVPCSPPAAKPAWHTFPH